MYVVMDRYDYVLLLLQGFFCKDEKDMDDMCTRLRSVSNSNYEIFSGALLTQMTAIFYSVLPILLLVHVYDYTLSLSLCVCVCVCVCHGCSLF